MSQSDAELLKKFQRILIIAQEVKKSDVAKSLGISEEYLFEKLVEWSHLGFKLNKEYIVVENIAEFSAALDQQFIEWNTKEHSGFGKVENLYQVNQKNTDSSKKKKEIDEGWGDGPW
jgi:hypothetical protein